MLDQLSLLTSDGDSIVSVGPPPKSRAVGQLCKIVRYPMGIRGFAGWGMRTIPPAKIIHAWSLTAALAVKGFPRRKKCKGLLSLPFRPRNKDLKSLLGLVGKSRFQLTVPTHTARTALLHAGFDAQAVHVLNPCSEQIEDMQDRRRRTREALGVSNEEYLLVAAVEMIRDAGHRYASWAHAIVRQIRDDVRLLLPGGGPIRTYVEFFAHTTGYDDEVFLTEDRFDRCDALAAGDIALFVGERDIGVCSLAAAMAAELPIVASETPEIAECIPHEVAGLLCGIRDPRAVSAAILRILEEPGLAYRLAAEVKQRARKLFGAEISRKQLTEIYG